MTLPDAPCSVTGMTQTSKATCGDCGTDVSRGALIVSTVICKVAVETLCCVPIGPGWSDCALGFMERAARALGAEVEDHGHGHADVFVDDDHFVKIVPRFGPISAR